MFGRPIANLKYIPTFESTNNTKHINTYEITYTGNASRFNGKTFEVEAISPTAAVKSFYENKVGDLFELEDGGIKDECGNWVDYGDNWIEYDGGNFEAKLLD